MQDTSTWYTFWPDQSVDSTYFMPFIPMRYNPDNMTISLNATHPSNNVTEYDAHSLFGHMQAKTIKQLFIEGKIDHLNGKLSFILSRSTFAGSGKYTQHWLGDNHRSWDNMRYSIAGIMNMNMFGIPMVGADVCGFFALPEFTEEENQEICGRWMQLSTLYPFARQHRDKTKGGGAPNEPYNLGYFKDMAKNAIIDRYSYIHFMYTCLYEASVYGRTCYDPLIFHYPEIESVYDDTEETFLVGDAILVSPVLLPYKDMKETTQPVPGQENKRIDAFFPPGTWVNLDDFLAINIKEPKGQIIQLKPNNNTVIKHLRPGYLISRQKPQSWDSINTNYIPYANSDLLINRDDNKYAKGSILYSMGEKSIEIEAQYHQYYKFTVSRNSIQKQTIVSDGDRKG